MAYTPPPNPAPMNQAIEGALFIDIETVPKVRFFKDLDERGQNLFVHKYEKEISEMVGSRTNNIEITWLRKAALHAEFNTIVCLSMGKIRRNESGEVIYVKSLIGDEMKILTAFAEKVGRDDVVFLVAHNGFGFDYPMLSRKYMMHALPIPSILQTMDGRKPWDILTFDTLDMWRGQSRDAISLDALAYALGLPSSKDDISGADVGALYWGLPPFNHELPWDQEDAVKRIAIYCNKDVAIDANCYVRMIGRPPIENVVTLEK